MTNKDFMEMLINKGLLNLHTCYHEKDKNNNGWNKNILEIHDFEYGYQCTVEFDENGNCVNVY